MVVGLLGLGGPLAPGEGETPGSAWSRVPHDDEVFGGLPGIEEVVIWDVTTGGPGFVAVGEWTIGAGYGGSGLPAASVWVSADGTDWERVAEEEEDFEDASMAAITAGGPGLVAVGKSCPPEDPHCDAAVWTSPDGSAWARVPHEEDILGDAAVNDVAVGSPGLVAVGSARRGDRGVGAVWASPDGIVWTRVPHDEEVFGGTGDAWIDSVTEGGPGLVAVGGRFREGRPEAAAWVSPDGQTWSAVEVVEGFEDARMRAVTQGGPGLVAVGSGSHGEEAAVWVSPDGMSWERVKDEALAGAEMADVTSTGGGLVAVGAERSLGGPAVVWLSEDGLVWERIDDPVFEEAGMTGVVFGASRLVAVGSQDGWAGVVWVSPPAAEGDGSG